MSTGKPIAFRAGPFPTLYTLGIKERPGVLKGSFENSNEISIGDEIEEIDESVEFSFEE